MNVECSPLCCKYNTNGKKSCWSSVRCGCIKYKIIVPRSGDHGEGTGRDATRPILRSPFQLSTALRAIVILQRERISRRRGSSRHEQVQDGHADNKEGRVQICRVENFCSSVREWNVVSDLARKMCGELFDEPAVLFKDKLNYKMPGGGGFLAHQDFTTHKQDEFASSYINDRNRLSCYIYFNHERIHNKSYILLSLYQTSLKTSPSKTLRILGILFPPTHAILGTSDKNQSHHHVFLVT